MGGDFAPAAVVEGAANAARQHGIEVTLVGRTADVEPLLLRAGKPPNVELIDAPEVVGMDEPPAHAVRRKKGASLVVCAELVKQGRADAMVSAGNTGAGMAISIFTFGRIAGI